MFRRRREVPGFCGRGPSTSRHLRASHADAATLRMTNWWSGAAVGCGYGAVLRVIYKTVLTENSTIRSLFLDGPAGRLEALLNGGSASATHAALVCHPHPLYGGTLHNKVVFHTMKALHGFGFPVLRFN